MDPILQGWILIAFFVIDMIGMAVVYTLAEYKWKKEKPHAKKK
jgi:hypothetical protein